MSDSLPVITIPATMAEKVKTFGNLTYKVADIKQIVEATLNYFVDELSEGRSITIPKMMKLTRELRKARDFHVPGDKTKTTSKPARYSLKATIATATKDAIEKIPVDDAEKVVESDAEEVEKVTTAKPTKAKRKTNNA
jgi:nucleoid DNA-binding protein